MSKIGDIYYFSKKIKRFLLIWRKRILKRKYYRLKKDFSVTFFEKRMQSLILIQMKISTLCLSKEKNENTENSNFLFQEFSDFVENQNSKNEKKELKNVHKMKNELFDSNIKVHDYNNNSENSRNNIYSYSREDFTPSRSGILGVGLRSFLSPNRNRK